MTLLPAHAASCLLRADFRLTPEEQDIAYEFKAHVMRKIHSQNQNIKKELELHEKKVDLKKCQQAHKKQIEDQQKSQTTLVNLTNVYEKRALQGTKNYMLVVVSSIFSNYWTLP